jgi:hypothetical protein
MPEHESKSAYSRWLAYNARGPEPDPWRRTTAEEAGSYNLWNDRHRLNQGER